MISMREQKKIKNPVLTIRNTGKQQQLLDLLQFRNIIVKELYLMSKITVTKTLFDRIHYSMLIKNQNQNVIGGICYYEITAHRCSNIIYFVIDPLYQANGYGKYLMTHFKQSMKQKGFTTLVAQADTISLNFYYKNGFIEFEKKSKKLERQPIQNEIKDNFDHEDIHKKYKRYEPWLDYIEDYYSSVLVVYKIHPKTDYQNLKSIVSLQKQGLLTRLNGRKYRNYSFDRSEMQKLIEDHRKKFESHYGWIQDPKKKRQISNQLDIREDELIQSQKSISKLQQLALLKILKKHPSSFILKLQFIKIPDSFHDQLSNIITLQFIEQNILNNTYKSSSELCAELTKLFQNLRLFLSSGSNYYRACEELEIYMRPYLQQVCQGTFNVMQIIHQSI